MTLAIEHSVLSSIHHILAQPMGTLDVTAQTRLDDLGIDSMGFIRIFIDLEHVGVNLSTVKQLRKLDTVGDIIRFACALAKADDLPGENG